MISNQLKGQIGLFALPLLTLQAVVEEVRGAGDQPGDPRSDAGDSDLDVVQIAVFVRSGEVVGTEGAEQQGQEKVQHLFTFE